MRAALARAGQLAVLVLVAAGAAALSNGPNHRSLPDGVGVLTLSFGHGADRKAACRPATAEELVADGARLCVLGTGDHSLITGLQAYSESAAGQGRVAVVDRFDRGLARRMYAGADAFLMPSRFEPCGQGQMIAMRYGTVPVVRATGGLRDTVIDADLDPERGTGFVFGPAEPVALADACRRAMAALRRAAIGRVGPSPTIQFDDIPGPRDVQQVAAFDQAGAVLVFRAIRVVSAQRMHGFVQCDRQR